MTDPATLAIHAGEDADATTGAYAPNLVMATNFATSWDALDFSAPHIASDAPLLYSRWGNPTVRQLESKLAALEGGEEAVAFASGMAAISSVLMHLLGAGDHVVVSDVCYPGTLALASRTLPRMGIEVSRADLSDEADVLAALRPNTSVIWAETPANPILRLTDLRALAEIAHDAGALLVVDGTFAPSTITRALDFGADIVVQSLTKYYSGHGDVVAGAAVGPARQMQRLREEAMGRFGAALSPFNAWLVLRGIATLPLRTVAHSRNARFLARWLEGHPAVDRVLYPGLPSHPQHGLACRQMAHPGGMVSVRVRGGEVTARRVAEGLRLFHYAVSLGHHKSLALYLPTEAMQEGSLGLDAEHLSRYRDWAGDGIFRLSVGLEAPEDLRDDLDRALSAALDTVEDQAGQPIGGRTR